MGAALSALCTTGAHAQPSLDKEPAPAISFSIDYCSVPLCRDAEGLQRSGDLQGALKLLRYIQEEVDVDEKVLRKPLLLFPMAALSSKLRAPHEGLELLRTYRQYVEQTPDSDLPAGQRREDIERLYQELNAGMGRIRITTKDVGLRVIVDGKESGTTPLPGPLTVAPGHHRVEFVGSGQQAQELEVPYGQEVVIWPLSAPASSGPGALDSSGTRSPRPAWRIALGTIGLGAGVTLIALGGAALAADGHCAPPAQPTASGQCPIELNGAGQPVMRLVDGKGPGAGLITAGVLATAAGAVLIALPGKRRSVHAAASFLNGASLSVSIAF